MNKATNEERYLFIFYLTFIDKARTNLQCRMKTVYKCSYTKGLYNI